MDEEERVEHDRFRERDRENRLHQNRSRRAGIAADRGSRAHADESDADGRAEGREADVNASGHFCQYW